MGVQEEEERRHKLYKKQEQIKLNKWRKLNLLLFSQNTNKTLQEQKHICLTTFICFSTSATINSLLPISIDTNPPHIQLKIENKSDPDIFLPVAYDTCAVLNVGYALFN